MSEEFILGACYNIFLMQKDYELVDYFHNIPLLLQHVSNLEYIFYFSAFNWL